ncbi:MAG: glycoside hydrolase family 2 protein [Bacteroidales bacterium]|nr:glycoside hydrolase family 2 protein [Bacteroidales bacterium]
MKDTANARYSLDRNWEFEHEGKWYPAKTPGCIHTDLLTNGLIGDPFYRNNEDSVQWIAEREWKYRTTFTKEEAFNLQHAELVFEGLDCYAELYLNGNPFIHEGDDHFTNNMFRRWVFPLDKNQLQDENEIIVIFHPSAVIDIENAKRYHYPLPDIRALTRKSPYQSGWDWGPKLVTCGIWKPVYINQWNQFKINDLQIRQMELTDKLAVLKVEVSMEVTADCSPYFDIYLDRKLIVTSHEQNLSPGEHTFSYDYKIENPKRWFPNGLGKQEMYMISVQATDEMTQAQASRRIGLRNIELVQQTDSIGQSFEFHVNGKPVFMKGANWIPAESFPSSVTPERYHDLVKTIKESNMNMVRVWGGGIYESDIFYDYCDEMGVLVWQDFIFAGAIYPEDKEFHDNVRIEATEQVRRLRNHPSLALWCGNNEVKNAWEDWGWQADYTEKQKARISENIHAIFNVLLDSVVQDNDPERNYIPTSPLWGWGHPESFTEGNAHYWGVWWGEQPFEVWGEKTGRFMAEYGFQSYPEMNSIKKFTLPEDWEITSPVINNHQKHHRGVIIISKAMEQYFGKANDFEDFVYLSQLTQAYGIGNAIETHRRRIPYCMGTLYWQLNDCWPVASWSGIDYYLAKKASYYEARKQFEPVIIATAPFNENTLPIYIVSEHAKDFTGILTVNLFDFTGNLLESYPLGDRIAAANTSTLVAHFELPKEYAKKRNQIFITINFDHPEVSVPERIVYLEYPKNLKLSKATVNYNVTKEKGVYQISITSDALAKGVYFYTTNDITGDYSDNYFDVLPNQEKMITYTSKNSGEKPVFGVKWYNNGKQDDK